DAWDPLSAVEDLFGHAFVIDTSLERDVTVFDLNLHLSRVEPKLREEHVSPDLELDLLVPARECADEICPRHDPDELSRIDNREPVNPDLEHQLGSIGDRPPRRDRDRR